MEFEFVRRRKSWDGDRAFFRGPDGDVVSLPAAWTDVVPPDPFAVMAGGRVPFRTADLLAAAELISRLGGDTGSSGSGVREILS